METKIIPIAGGKGGVGKSTIAANLAIALASLKCSVALADLDLGGSNLHTCLGLPNNSPGIGDYLKTREFEFEDLLLETEWKGLRFIPGDGRMPFMANTTYSQKLDIIKKLKNIKADYLLLDLGSGTSFNTLDFFRIAHHGLVITSPAQTAINNMLGFVKNIVFRAIDRTKLEEKSREEVQRLYNQPVKSELYTIKEHLKKLQDFDPESADKIKEICQRYRPRLIMNFVKKTDDLKKLRKVEDALEGVLSIKSDQFGYILEDDEVDKSLENNIPLIKFNPKSKAALNILNIAGRIIHWWDKRPENSAEKLLAKLEKDLVSNPSKRSQ